MSKDVEKLVSVIEKVIPISSTNEPISIDTELLGVVPELDSINIVKLMVELENNYDISVDDVDASVLGTVGSLLEFVSPSSHTNG